MAPSESIKLAPSRNATRALHPIINTTSVTKRALFCAADDEQDSHGIPFAVMSHAEANGLWSCMALRIARMRDRNLES